YGVCASPFGMTLLGIISEKIVWLSFFDNISQKIAQNEMQESWAQIQFTLDNDYVLPYINQLFSAGKNARIPIMLQGTDFQMKVWQKLMEVPFGKHISYEELATSVADKNSTRAVANAVAKNAIAFIVPCHRIIHKNGNIGKYRWGS